MLAKMDYTGLIVILVLKKAHGAARKLAEISAGGPIGRRADQLTDEEDAKKNQLRHLGLIESRACL